MRVAFSLLLLPSVSSVVRNTTVYRITPRNYSGITNLDTGDAAGDAFFGLYEKSAAVVCDGDQAKLNLVCSNEPLLQIPGFNEYLQVTLELDDEYFGDYAQCNPSTTPPHPFTCTHHSHGGPPTCWTANPAYKVFAPFCDPNVCLCDVIENMTVGREFPHFGTPPVSPDFPKQCAASYFQLKNFKNKNASTVIKTVKKTTLAACCSACTAVNVANATCGSYVFTKDLFSKTTGTCELHGATIFSDLAPALLGEVGFFTGTGPAAFVQRATGALSEIMNGRYTTTFVITLSLSLSTSFASPLAFSLLSSLSSHCLFSQGTWFSTQAVGRCNTSEQVIGKDCWWREVETKRSVNATCVNDNMVDAVVAQRKGDCFNDCPSPKDQNSKCWTVCFFETLVGNTTATPPLPPTPRALILNAFENSFNIAEISKGGCPDIPPCRDPCLPPCWGVSKGTPCDPHS